MLLAACGFLLSLDAHIMALAGLSLPGGNWVWGLHIGIFIVWIPTVLVSRQAAQYANRKDFWKVVLAACPVWMRRALYIIFGYAILNFILFLPTTGTHKLQKGVSPPPSVIRGFSGHWMAFYGAAFCSLYSAINAPNLFRERKCPNGHPVSPTAHFCPECGYAFPDN
jgi:hypothetical protein